jgi:hypothetical protein
MFDVRQALACRIQSDKLKFVGQLFEISSPLREISLPGTYFTQRPKGNPKPQRQKPQINCFFLRARKARDRICGTSHESINGQPV